MKRNPRLYGLFEKRDGKWVKLSPLNLPKQMAVSHWQTVLLNSFFAGKQVELRPVPRD